MPIAITCPSCDRLMRFADQDAGLVCSCLSCGATLAIPARSAFARADRALKAELWIQPPTVRHGPGPVVAGLLSVATLVAVVAVCMWWFRLLQDRTPVGGGGETAVAMAPAAIPASMQVAATAPSTQVSVAATRVVLPETPPAAMLPASPYPVGLIGLDRLEFNGQTMVVDSYNAAAGPYAEATASDRAPIVSNSKIRLYGKGKVRGMIRLPAAGDLKTEKAVHVLASPKPLLQAIVPMAIDAAKAAATTNDNSQLAGKYFRDNCLRLSNRATLAVPSGTYSLKDLDIEVNSTLVLDGAVTIYISGRVFVVGKIETAKQLPANLRFRVTSEQAQIFTNVNNLYLDLYAPKAFIEVSGTGQIYGSIVGKTVRVSGDRQFHFDESINGPVIP